MFLNEKEKPFYVHRSHYVQLCLSLGQGFVYGKGSSVMNRAHGVTKHAVLADCNGYRTRDKSFVFRIKLPVLHRAVSIGHSCVLGVLWYIRVSSIGQNIVIWTNLCKQTECDYVKISRVLQSIIYEEGSLISEKALYWPNIVSCVLGTCTKYNKTVLAPWCPLRNVFALRLMH